MEQGYKGKGAFAASKLKPGQSVYAGGLLNEEEASYAATKASKLGINDSTTYRAGIEGEVTGSLAQKMTYLIEDDIMQEDTYARESGFTNNDGGFAFGTTDKSKHETITSKSKTGN